MKPAQLLRLISDLCICSARRPCSFKEMFCLCLKYTIAKCNILSKQRSIMCPGAEQNRKALTDGNQILFFSAVLSGACFCQSSIIVVKARKSDWTRNPYFQRGHLSVLLWDTPQGWLYSCKQETIVVWG